MNGIFSYDSKLMQVLGFIADLFICNLLYTICCIPIITIGPAQAGLHSAMRTLGDTEDDRSAVKQFFKGFASGFLKMSGAWMLVAVAAAVIAYTAMFCYMNQATGMVLPWGFPLAMLAVVLCYQSMIPAFHSQFDCTFGQLLRNSLITTIMHPICAVLLGAVTYWPLINFIMFPTIFMQVSLLYLTVYFSTTYLLLTLVLKKPFKMLIDHYTGEDLIEEERKENARKEEAEIEAEARANLENKKKK